METLTTNENLSTPFLKRQTHMHCTICENVAEFYNQIKCNKCGSILKWSIPWKNEKYIKYPKKC